MSDNKLNTLFKKPFSTKSGCYIVTLASLLGYFFYHIIVNGKPHASGYYLIHYLYTYNHGFVARGLLGEIISYFYDTVSNELVSNITTFFSFLLFVATGLCIGKALSKVKDDSERFLTVAALSVIACALPASLGLHLEAIHLDKIFWALALFCVFISDRKYAAWLVPPLCVAATLINPLFLFSSMILVSIILLQQLLDSKFSLKRAAICIVSYASMIAVGIYSPISEKKLGFSSPAELLEFYFARYDGTLSQSTYDGFVNEWLYDYFEPIDEILKLSVEYYLIGLSWAQRCVLYFIFVALPVYLLLTKLWKTAIKYENNKFQKFIYFLCMISPVVIIPPLILGWELPRYVTDNVLVQLGLIIYFVCNGHAAVLTTIKQIIEYCKEHIATTVIVALYFVTVIVM